jgi:mitochondrial fission protein ELM1
MTPEVAAQAAQAWRARMAELPEPRLAVLVGGPSGSARWAEADAGRLAGAVAGAVAEGWGVMVTGSRRTPEEVLGAVREAAPGAYVWDGEGENPYPAVLGLARAALVTADSVNMVSEAASAGLPVNLFAPSGLSGKLRRFGEDMVTEGHARAWEGRVQVWETVPLDEAGRVAAVLAERL